MVTPRSGVALSAAPMADGQLVPAAVSSREPAPAGRGERVELRLALVVALAPFGGDQALVLEPVERRIERALRDLQGVAGDLLDAEQDAVAVQRLERHRLENQHVERARQQVGLVRRVDSPSLARSLWGCSPSLSRRERAVGVGVAGSEPGV